MSTITRRSAIGLAVATALAPFIAQAGTQCLILSGGATLNVGTGALCGIGQKFDYYIAPSGDDITGAGTLASPWSITALGTMPNRATSAAKWTTYAGKRVGLIGDQGTYTQGKANGTVTTLASLMTYDGGFGPGTCLFINGGTSAAPTYIGSSNSAGYEVPRLATVDFSSGTGKQSQIHTHGIGQGTQGTNGANYPSNWGNYMISGLVLENFSVSAVNASYNPGIGPLTGVIVQVNELKGGAAWSNSNPAAVFMNENIGTQIIGNKIHDCFSVSNAMLGSMNASISGSVLTVNSIVAGWSITTFSVGQSIYIANAAGTAAYATIASFGTGTGGTGTYNLSTSPGNVTAQTMWLGEDSAFPSWGMWAWVCFNSTGLIVTGNTTYNVGILGTKDTLQGAVVSYNYFEFGEWGTWPVTPNASSSATGATGYQNIIAGQRLPAYVHHNIVTGPNCNYLMDCFGEDGVLNEGTLTIDHNTFYSPATNLSTPSFMRLEQSTSGGTVGTAQFTNNVLWSDANSAAGWEVGACFYMPTGFTNLAFDYNALQHNVTYGTVFGTATYTGVPAWHTGTGQDAHSISLATTPFATTPVSQTPSTFQVAGAALTGSSTGGVMGALDGTGVIGCGF